MKSGSNLALSLATTQAKALKLFYMVKQHCDEGSKAEKFNANKAWFMHFKGSDALYNIRVQDEAAGAEVAVPESRKTLFLEGSKRTDTLSPKAHASHSDICDSNKKATKLMLLNLFSENLSNDPGSLKNSLKIAYDQGKIFFSQILTLIRYFLNSQFVKGILIKKFYLRSFL